MANFNSLKATIDAQIKANGVQAITGPILNAVLTAMINTIGNGYSLQGSVAQTTDNPGAPDNPVAYLAAGPGTYTNFGATVIPDDGHAYLLTWDTSWHAVQLPLPTYDLANGKQDALTFDNVPTLGSDNPVKSDGIAQELDDKQDKDTGDTAGHVAVMDGNGNSVDGGEALSDLATKEDVEAVEQEVAQVAGEAGLAEAVIDTDNAGTEQEFTFRKSGGDGGAYYRKIKGKSVVVNQIATPFGAQTLTENNCTITYDGNGNITIIVGTGGASANTLIAICAFAPDIIWQTGHKYLCKSVLNFTAGSDSIRVGNNYYLWWDEAAYIWTADGSSGGYSAQIVAGCPAGTYTIKQSRIIDLTLWFGVGNEPSTVAEFEALYPNPLPYNPGTLKSNDADAVETTGANQWDEEWELGTYSPTTGEKVPDAGNIRCKNPIPVFPSTDYYISGGFDPNVPYWGGRIFEYDANGNFIAQYDSPSRLFTTGASCRYITFHIASQYGTTYNHDICINLSNPAINGQYFPYWKRTLQLGLTTKEDTDGNVPFPNGLQSCPVAQDEATKEGGTIRVGTRAYQAGDESDADVITDGTNTNYALTTPQTFTWKEPLNLGVKVDENGTERAVQPAGATEPSAPFVADTTYTMSIARMVAILQGI